MFLCFFFSLIPYGHSPSSFPFSQRTPLQEGDKPFGFTSLGPSSEQLGLIELLSSLTHYLFLSHIV